MRRRLGSQDGFTVVEVLVAALVMALGAVAVMQVLDGITEPILDPIRRIMPRIGMLDLSPLVAIILLQFISRGLQDFFG